MKYGIKLKIYLEKKIDSEPVYNNKYNKTKINLYNRNFYGNKAPIQGKCYGCIPVLLLDCQKSTNILKRMQICNKEEQDSEYN